MGYRHIQDLSKCEVSPIKERVGKHNRNVIGEISHAKSAHENLKSNDEEKDTLSTEVHK